MFSRDFHLIEKENFAYTKLRSKDMFVFVIVFVALLTSM